MSERDRPDPEGVDDTTRAFDPLADDATRAMGPPVEDADEATRAMAAPVSPPPTATQRFGTTPMPQAGPSTERIAVAEQRSLAGWLVALAIVIALIAGIAVGYAQSEGNDEGVQARALVGPDGGVLDFDDNKGKLEIPQGALPTATAITVRKVTNENRIRIGGDSGERLYEPGEVEMYVFEPADLNLQKPVKVTLPRPPDGSALLVDTPQGPRVVAAQMDGDKVQFETSTFALDDLG